VLGTPTRRLCAPIVAFDERCYEPLSLLLAAAHGVGTDAKCEGGVGVAELRHRGRGSLPIATRIERM